MNGAPMDETAIRAALKAIAAATGVTDATASLVIGGDGGNYATYVALRVRSVTMPQLCYGPTVEAALAAGLAAAQEIDAASRDYAFWLGARAA